MRALKFATFLMLLSFISYSQEPNDCINAITICGNGTFTSNASGPGTFQEVAGCGGYENNSVWLKVNIINAGTLGFNLIPTNADLAVDYDFWVYGANMPCNNLGSPIRCCTTNPLAANLSSNVTGMVGATITTTSGPGDLGNGFVRWINVQPGEFYYIAIDRPEGDGGFQLEWTGTAMNNGGAFPVPPTAASLGEVRSCSNTSNAGIFDLNSIKSQINSDITNNTVSFYLNASDATDGTNSLPNIYGNISNPQTIFARVKNNISGCFTITSFQLKVYEIPNATITTSTPTICSNGTGIIKINGTPNAIIEYNVNGGATQTTSLDNLGVLQISSPLTITSTYTLTKVKIVDASNITLCSQNLNVPVTITILPLPSVTSFTSNSPICLGEDAIFSVEGTPNTTVTYSVNNGTPANVSIGVTGFATITVPSPTTSPTIVLSQIAGATCSEIITNSSTVVLLPIPNVSSVSSNSPICLGSNAVYTVNGTPNAIITYTLNGGASQTAQIPTSGILLLNVIAPSVNPELVISFIDNGSCTKTLSLNSTVIIDQPPVILNLTSNNSVCTGNNAQFVLQGTPNAEVFYTINNGVVSSIIIGNSGMETISIPAPTSTVTMNLTLIRKGVCDVIVTNSSQVIVNQLPQLVLMTNNSPICNGSDASFVITATPFTNVTYSINNSPSAVASIDNSGLFSINLNNVTATTTLQIVSIADTNCTAIINQTSQVFVSPDTTLTLLSATGSNSQMRCENSNISPLQYQVQGTATGVTVSGLPLGITQTYNTVTKILTISGAANTSGIYPFTIETTGGCEPQVTATGTFTITDQPNMNVTFSNSICSGALTDIVLASDLVNTTYTWTATVTNLSATYNLSGNQGDINQIANLSNLLALGKIVMTITPFANGCFGISKTIEIAVNPIPQINSITNETSQVCSGSLIKVTIAGLPSITTYNWTGVTSGVTIIGSSNGTTSGIINLQVQLTNPLVSGTIQFQITPILGTCTGTMQTSTLINVVSFPNLPQTFPIQNACSGTALSLQISDNPHVAGTTLVWEVDQMVNAIGATSGSGIAPITITDLLTATNNQAGYVVYKVKSVLATCETDYVYYRVNVNAIPEPILEDGYMCFDADGNIIQSHYLNAGNFTGNYQFFWHKVTTTDDVIGVSSGPIYQVYTPGMYYVVARNIATGCFGTSNTVEVISITSPNDIDYTVTDAFTENAQISITIDGGTGEYLSKLDDGPFQTSLNFTGVSSGIHLISVMNTKGCSLFTKEVNVIGYPKYFTPNGDGIHDTWNIIGMNQPDAKVHIYDRFGKLLKQITPNLSSQGWDGTYFGSLMPSTDYWFTIEYKENNIQKLFKAHFALKR